jgi:hypothetical protein
MSMTNGDELGKSDVFVKLAVMLFPLAEEAVRRGMTMKEFERGLLGGLRFTGDWRAFRDVLRSVVATAAGVHKVALLRAGISRRC